MSEHIGVVIDVVELFGITEEFYAKMNKIVARDIPTATEHYKALMNEATTENEKIFAGYCFGIIIALDQY